MSGPLLPLNGLTIVSMALPTIVGTFLKHLIPPKDSHLSNRSELKLDEAFSVARAMIQKFSQYPIEDIQRLTSISQPSPWNVRVIRVSIPASTCSSAAEYLIAAFGVAELQNVIGGRQWWQLRSNKDASVEGEWIAMKRDLPRSPSQYSNSPSPSKSSPPSGDGPSPVSKSPHASHIKHRNIFDSICNRGSKSCSRRNCSGSTDTAAIFLTASPEVDPTILNETAPPPQLNTPDLDPAQGPSPILDPLFTTSEQSTPRDPYEDDLDQMPCMLYIHGGAYYFGSVNTHRYTIWRYARKMGGRAFAVNYRLAPQYPFPCALMDCLAAYLYLIQPPPDAKHRAVDPSKIVIAGDSAGGGLSLALLTLIRDVGLPMPAGAVLISPWVDLTHSFPSVMDNAETDIIPPYGFMHQPSVLWPPPPAGDKTDLKKPVQSESSSQPLPSPSDPQSHPTPNIESVKDQNPYKLKVSPEVKIRTDKSDGTTPILEFDDGQAVVMNQQIQFYATNDQLTHPYCSPLFSPSLGGLPPLFIIAGQNEVLRDEIIYMAHRAAHPDRYPLREDLLNANPERKSKAIKYSPTQVHLQVYDDMFHVLPLFSFLRPAKYCYRAIGSFCKFVTGPVKEVFIDPSIGLSDSSIKRDQNATVDIAEDALQDISRTSHDSQIPSINAEHTTDVGCSQLQVPTPPSSLRAETPGQVPRMSIEELPRIKTEAVPVDSLSPETLTELEHTIYHASLPHRRPHFQDGMIRERVALDGKIRPLEDESELELLKVSPEELGIIKVGPLKRWAEGRKIWNQKFMRKHKKIQLLRDHHIRLSNKKLKQSLKKVSKFRHSKPESVTPTQKSELESGSSSGMEQTGSSADAHCDVIVVPKIPIGRFLSEDERPPPCAVAARDDNLESLKLAKAQRQRQSKAQTAPPAVAA